MQWRVVALLILWLLPLLIYMVIGIRAVWSTGIGWWLWWIFPVCWVTAFLLARLWRRALSPPPILTPEQMTHWTARDEAAWQLVEAEQRRVESYDATRLTDTSFYVQTAQNLALQMARHYHPQAKDPVGSLTMVEILAAAQLALEDAAEWVDQYVPGSHLLTIRQWRSLSQAPGWLKAAGDATWAVRVLWQPAALARYVTTKLATDSTASQIRRNAMAWFYLAFVRYVGFYLIEMHSGRLRAGAARYRQAMREMQRHEMTPSTDRPKSDVAGGPTSAAPEDGPSEVLIALVGQVNAGKSSLVNALLGEHKATVDVLPQTSVVTRYTLQLSENDGNQTRLVLLDTPGYGAVDTVPRHEEETWRAIAQADVVLLVMNAKNPARQADLNAYRALATRFHSQPQLKPPSFVAVLTHADLLSPVMEWNPPYDWTRPQCAKETSMADAAHRVQQEFGGELMAVVPVCSDVERHREFGVQEVLLPTLVALLDEARACAMLKNLYADLNRGQLQALLRQLGSAGWGIIQVCILGGRNSRGDVS